MWEVWQHDTSAIKKGKTQEVKKSVLKYLAQLPPQLADILVRQNRSATYSELVTLHEELALYVWNFQANYINSFIEYVFVWIENFNSFFAKPEERQAFANLLKVFTQLGKKPIMAYGGYDAILLCHPEITNRLYGVAQSVGYGEAREVTPVGGGLPVNKYYFLPLHERLNVGEAAQLLMADGYFSSDKTNFEQAKDYYSNICDCATCHDVVRNNIEGFNKYNESMPVVFKTGVKRNTPTTDAALIAAKHFVHCKITEWSKLQLESLEMLFAELLRGASQYGSDAHLRSIEEWCNLYAR